MKKCLGLTIGVLGMCFIPLAIIFVAFRSACTFVGRLAAEGLNDES